MLVPPTAVLLIVIAVVVGATTTKEASFGGGAGGGIVFGDSADTTTPVDPLEVDCIVNSLAEDDRLNEAVTAATESYSRGSWDGDEAYLNYGRKLSLIDLSDCPFEYSQDFQRYATASTEYGKWISQHTGLSHALAGSDRSGMRQLQAEIISTYDEMMSVVKHYRPDLVRKIAFPS
jgi:hypothetical protein